MYSDNDLEQAVVKTIFSREQVEKFRADILASKNTHTADEENFKLFSSFNDIFVVIACALLLGSAGWVTWSIGHSVAMVVVAGLSWGLAEFFVRKRKMALPAIFLLLSFLSTVFFSIASNFSLNIHDPLMTMPLIIGLIVTVVAAWFHWHRFRVPITIAAGASSVALFFTFYLVPSLGTYFFPSVGYKPVMLVVSFLTGIAIFLLAMWWDSRDLKRVTEKSDIAFWCHLVAAPMIVHPVFSQLGIFEGNQSSMSLLIVLMLYLLLSIVSLVIDRRAFMVPSLIYVLYAFSALLNQFGLQDQGFAYVGLVIGLSLLLLSGFWHKARGYVVQLLPLAIQTKVPPIA